MFGRSQKKVPLLVVLPAGLLLVSYQLQSGVTAVHYIDRCVVFLRHTGVY